MFGYYTCLPCIYCDVPKDMRETPVCRHNAREGMKCFGRCDDFEATLGRHEQHAEICWKRDAPGVGRGNGVE